MSVEHTPTPWKLRPASNTENEAIVTEEYGTKLPNGFIYLPTAICVLHEGCKRSADQVRADANFIIKACNLHDELVAAIKGLYSDLQRISSPDTRWERPTAEAARNVLAKALEKSS